MLQIDPNTHALFLYYLSELPFDEARELRMELQDTYAACIAEVANYQFIELKIRAKMETKCLPKGME